MKYREGQPVRGGIVSLEKGLGKTLTALKRMLEDRHLGPSLYITKNDLIGEVLIQLKQFFGEDNKIRYYIMHQSYNKSGPDQFTMEHLRNYDLIITTYEMINKSARLCNAHQRILVYQNCRNKMRVVAYQQPQQNQISQDPKHYTGYAILHQIVWKHIICDEIQIICNPKTAGFRSVVSLRSL